MYDLSKKCEFRLSAFSDVISGGMEGQTPKSPYFHVEYFAVSLMLSRGPTSLFIQAKADINKPL